MSVEFDDRILFGCYAVLAAKFYSSRWATMKKTALCVMNQENIKMERDIV